MKPANYVHKNKQVIFSISDADYAVMALTMFDSVRKFYPDSDLFLFVIGTGSISRLENGVNVVYIADVLDKLDLNQRLAYYLQVELATSVRPNCFEFLFAQNYDRAIYLDPDIYVFRRMTEVDILLDGAANGIVTPHILKSLKTDVCVSGDNVFLQCGIFNMGFLALKRTDETARMVAWWKEKLKWKCIVDCKNGYFVDQKWLDFLPAFFDAFHVLKSPAYNLAPWNAEHYKIISDSRGNFYIDSFEHPVAFIHFSGAKRSDHHFLYLKEAHKFYLTQLQKRKFMRLGFVNYNVRFKPDNLYFDKVCTFLYKDYVNNNKDTDSDPLMDKDFYNFLHSIDSETKLPVYIRKLFEILPDVFIRYLSIQQPIDFENLATWIKNDFPFDGVVSLETMLQLRSNNSISKDYKIVYADTLTDVKSQAASSDKPSYLSSILSCMDNKQSGTINRAPKQIIVKSDRIEIITGGIRVCIPSLDDHGDLLNSSVIKTQNYTEIWVPGEYCKKKLYKEQGLSNVMAIPYPVVKPKYEVKETGLPNNKFIVLMRHDFNEDFTIQNPLASLSAFQKAFGQRDDALLICYLANLTKSKDYERLIAAFSNEKNVKIVEDEQDNGLYYSYLHYAHCLISLHQETVFGYTLAEAMSLGKYVIATDNGSKAEYMNSDNSFLVDASSGKNITSDAAKVLLSIYNDGNVLDTKSKKARLAIQKHLSPTSIEFLIQTRLKALNCSKDPSITKSKKSLLLKKLRRFYILLSPLKPYLRKIPILVRVYGKLRTVLKYKAIMNSDRNQIAIIMIILLKNVNRPGVLE